MNKALESLRVTRDRLVVKYDEAVKPYDKTHIAESILLCERLMGQHDPLVQGYFDRIEDEYYSR